MSNINIPRAVENIRSTTTVFTPIVEIIVNAIDAIEEARQPVGLIRLHVRRAAQQELELEDEGSRITDVTITDNGIGFTDANRKSFDTLYSAQKIYRGGKGFGRLTCLRYFENVYIDSTYQDGELKRRRFSMGKDSEFIVDESITAAELLDTGSTVTLSGEKSGKLPRKLSSIARGLVELLLPYFTTHGYVCPQIELTEIDGEGRILLNDYVDSPGAIIHEVTLPKSTFELQGFTGPKEFHVRVFKFLSPQNKVSKLNEHVLLERGAFSFQRDNDLLLGISQSQIEAETAQLTKAAVLDQVVTRQEKKRERLNTYVEEQAPWYKPLLKIIDPTALSSAASESEMDALLHREKYKQERRVKEEFAAVLASNDPNELVQRTRELADRISESSKNELVHYVSLRRQVLELFKRSLELKDNGAFPSEDAVHSVIFPTKTQSAPQGLLSKTDLRNLRVQVDTSTQSAEGVIGRRKVVR